MTQTCVRYVPQIFGYRLTEWLHRDAPTYFNIIHHLLWVTISAVQHLQGAGSIVLNYINSKRASVYPYTLCLSIHQVPLLLCLSMESGDGGFFVKLIINLANHAMLLEIVGDRLYMRFLIAFAEDIRMTYGSVSIRSGEVAVSWEYNAQAAPAIGGQQLPLNVQRNSHRERQLQQMLEHSGLVPDNSTCSFVNPRSNLAGNGELFLDGEPENQLMLEADPQLQESNLHDTDGKEFEQERRPRCNRESASKSQLANQEDHERRAMDNHSLIAKIRVLVSENNQLKQIVEKQRLEKLVMMDERKFKSERMTQFNRESARSQLKKQIAFKDSEGQTMQLHSLRAQNKVLMSLNKQLK